jgi:hypothetical protein
MISNTGNDVSGTIHFHRTCFTLFHFPCPADQAGYDILYGHSRCPYKPDEISENK